MSTRIVTIKTGAAAKAIEHSTSATTFGELQKELSSINFSGQKSIIKENRTVLSGDSSALPTGNFTMLVVPSNMKAGNYTADGELTFVFEM